LNEPVRVGPGDDQPIDSAWIIGLPKAEVHLHLEGCIDPEMIAAASRRHRLPIPGALGGRSKEAPVISGLADLLTYLDQSCALIDRGEDLASIAYSTARRADAAGTRHIDVIFNPTHWSGFHRDVKAMVDALDAGFRGAEEDGYATATLCVSLKRTQSEQEATELVEFLVQWDHPRVSALSIDGDESKGSFNERFAPAFALAAARNLRRCAHAGESSGAQGVREAIEELGAERIDHGIRCTEDPHVVTLLSQRGVPLDICPTSNVVLGIVPGLGQHPVQALRAAGVSVSLNTDDPLVYGIDLPGEYWRCASAFSWTRADLVDIARTSIASCFADEDRRSGLLADLESYAGR
jgi:adenosine deaminase